MINDGEFEVDVRDVEYQSLAGKPWLARIYQPKGTGPFPTIVDMHGGAWHNGDRTMIAGIDRALVAKGVLDICRHTTVYQAPPVSQSTDRYRSRANDLQAGRFESSKVFRIRGCQRGAGSKSDGGNHTIHKRSASPAGHIE